MCTPCESRGYPPHAPLGERGGEGDKRVFTQVQGRSLRDTLAKSAQKQAQRSAAHRVILLTEPPFRTISFSVCVNNKYNRLEELLKNLRSKFKVTVYEDVDLHTVRHFDSKALASIENQKEKILLEQRAQETIQYVVER